MPIAGSTRYLDEKSMDDSDIELINDLLTGKVAGKNVQRSMDTIWI